MAMKLIGLAVHSVAWAEGYLCTKWHLDPSSHLATIDMGQELWGRGLLNHFLGEMGLHLTQRGLGQGLPPYQVAPLLTTIAAVLLPVMSPP